MDAAEQEPMPSVIPLFNLDEREQLMKRRRSAKRTKEEAMQINRIRQTRKTAKAGLKFYNEKQFQGGNYELVDEEAETSNWFIFRSALPRCYLHANFRAKKAEDDSGKTKLFFAEATFKKDAIGVAVLNCCIIDESDPTKFTRGCIHCGVGIIHPHASQYSYGNTIILNGRFATIDFNKISLEELVTNERWFDLHGWTGIDGLSEPVKLEPAPAVPSGMLM
ncbi:hypothetical protein LINGRAHAP2_LOCUS25771 [Linum grandiflorum]